MAKGRGGSGARGLKTGKAGSVKAAAAKAAAAKAAAAKGAGGAGDGGAGGAGGEPQYAAGSNAASALKTHGPVAAARAHAYDNATPKEQAAIVKHEKAAQSHYKQAERGGISGLGSDRRNAHLDAAKKAENRLTAAFKRVQKRLGLKTKV